MYAAPCFLLNYSFIEKLCFVLQRTLGERLYEAAFEGDADRLKGLLEKAKPDDINWRNQHGSSVLFVAAQQVRRHDRQLASTKISFSLIVYIILGSY
jgi:hypothetical protein